MKIDVLCNDGSPLGVTEKSISGDDGRMGVGGAELALLTMCRAWQEYGNTVRLYNDPKEAGVSSFEQLPIEAFNPAEDRDVLIIFRSPNERSYGAKGLKVWWSCDQNTVGDFREFSRTVQKIVTISPRHSHFFNHVYGIDNAITIDLPVRMWEYGEDVQKVSKRCIYTSMPDRGLVELNTIWPRIQVRVPEASLVITSDWRLWGDNIPESLVQPYRLSYANHPNIIYRAAVKRRELVQIQQSADLHLYPCVYDELFCIAVAESQVAGAYPITSDCGSLGTTNMGTILPGNASDPNWQETFVQKAVQLLNDPALSAKQEYVRQVSRKRFAIENILRQWDERVFK
jgi:glycosyltransferase involved in cell wall biosynthesis